MQEIEIMELGKQDNSTKEEYKSLRTNVSFCGEDIRVIALTSCTPNEGKSSVAFQLACSMAEDGKKVLLIDADVRKSVLMGRHKIKAKQTKGLTHYLSGQNKLEEVICSTNVEGMYMILTGPSAPNPSALLGSENFKKMIKAVREEYDMVIVDTPPLGLVIDSAIIARECDGVILVIASEEISYKFALKVKEQLEAANARILGAVLNKVKMRKVKYGKYGKYGKYYGNYYGSYYGYEESEKTEKDK